MGQRCDCGMTTPSFIWCPVFLLEVGRFPLPTVRHFIKGPSLWVLVISHFPSLWCILGVGWGGPPNLLFPEVACLHSFCWPSNLQSFSLTQYQIRFPSTSHCPPTLSTLPLKLLPPSPLVIVCFLLSPKWEWGIFTWSLQLVEPFEFCGLVLCILFRVFFFFLFLSFWLISSFFFLLRFIYLFIYLFIYM